MTWRETKIGTGVKKPKSKQMVGLNDSKNLSKKIKKIKEKQRKLQNNLKDEIKKADQFRISLEGLQNLSDSSVRSIQIKRDQALNRTKKIISEILENTKLLKNTENQFRKNNNH